MEQTENTMYVLVFSLEDYACSGQLRVMPSSMRYTLPGEKECITESNRQYDTNGDAEEI